MKRWLCFMLAGVLLLLGCTACNGEPASSIDASGTDNPAALVYAFGDAGVSITAMADKQAFSQPLLCSYNDQTLTVNPPRFTGIPVSAVYYDRDYRFSGGFVELSVALEAGKKTFRLDTQGRIVDDNYASSPTSESSVRPSDQRVEYAAGEGLYAYSGGTTITGEKLYGLMDMAGAEITPPRYVGYLNFYDGYAVAEKTDGTYVVVDVTGKEYGALPGGRSTGDQTVVVQKGEPGNYMQYLYNIQGEQLSDGYDCISYFADGLALIEKDKKIGIINSDGTVVLPPTITFDTIIYPPTIREYNLDFFDEHTFLLPIGGEFAVITIEQS